MITRTFSVGDQRTSIAAKLYRPGGTAEVLAATDTVTFRMVSSAGVVKVNDQAATIVSRGVAATNTPAEVRYDWAAGDIDTAGTYAAWFTPTAVTGETDHFPPQDYSDPQFCVIIRSVG